LPKVQFCRRFLRDQRFHQTTGNFFLTRLYNGLSGRLILPVTVDGAAASLEAKADSESGRGQFAQYDELSDIP
jgi:hypothetical protein